MTKISEVELKGKSGNLAEVNKYGQIETVIDVPEVSPSDLNLPDCVVTDWVDADGAGGSIALIPFENLITRITNSTATNPKILTIAFNRTVSLDQVGLGCATPGNFSNVMIKLLGSGGTVRTSVDDSANSTKYTSRNYPLAPELCNAIQIEFHTADAICLSNITVQKVAKTASRIRATDEDGVVRDVGCHESADGDYHLSSALIQNIWADPANSSSSNLNAANSYTFTGSATTTLGAAAIDWILKTDQNATVYVDQSINGTDWDISAEFDYLYSLGGSSITVKTVAGFYRVRVILTGTTDTTFFRLETRLSPISEPLPQSLDIYGRLKTTSGLVDVETGSKAQVEPLGSLKVITPVRLVGTPFNNGTKDPNFWVETVTGTGTVTQAGQITLATGTTALSSAKYATINKARKVTGTTNQFRMVGRLTTPPVVDNVRRAGAYDVNNGFFFQFNGTTFGVGSRKSTTDTIVSNGSFNGNYGSTVFVATDLGRFVVDYTSVAAKFFIDGVLLHTITSPTDSLVNSLDFPVTMENYNLGANVTNSEFQLRFATILRLGELLTSPKYRAINTNATFVLKYGSGVLQRIVNTDNAGTINVYDGVTAAGTLIATIDSAKTIGNLEFGAPFSDGLTIVSAGNAKFTVIYE